MREIWWPGIRQEMAKRPSGSVLPYGIRVVVGFATAIIFAIVASAAGGIDPWLGLLAGFIAQELVSGWYRFRRRQIE